MDASITIFQRKLSYMFSPKYPDSTFADQDCANKQENDTYEIFLSINLVILVVQE